MHVHDFFPMLPNILTKVDLSCDTADRKLK